VGQITASAEHVWLAQWEGGLVAATLRDGWRPRHTMNVPTVDNSAN